VLRAVFFDFGGVILSSPFEAFNHYEAALGLPANFIRSVNAATFHLLNLMTFLRVKAKH
jgi:hypothetical protein